MSYSIQHRMIQKAVLTENTVFWIYWLKERNICVMLGFFGICMHCSYEKGIESVTVKTGLDIKWQIKWLGLSMKLLGTLRYTLDISGTLFSFNFIDSGWYYSYSWGAGSATWNLDYSSSTFIFKPSFWKLLLKILKKQFWNKVHSTVLYVRGRRGK